MGIVDLISIEFLSYLTLKLNIILSINYIYNRRIYYSGDY